MSTAEIGAELAMLPPENCGGIDVWLGKLGISTADGEGGVPHFVQPEVFTLITWCTPRDLNPEPTD
jgi:hypothetical protein